MGRTSRTRSPPICPSPSTDLKSRFAVRMRCRFASRSITSKPTLCRVPAYSGPGLPRPTISFIVPFLRNRIRFPRIRAAVALYERGTDPGIAKLPELFAQGIQDEILSRGGVLIVPVFPAVAGGFVETLRCHFVDRAAYPIASDGAILQNVRKVFGAIEAQDGTDRQEAMIEQADEGYFQFRGIQRRGQHLIGNERWNQ